MYDSCFVFQSKQDGSVEVYPNEKTELSHPSLIDNKVKQQRRLSLKMVKF